MSTESNRSLSERTDGGPEVETEDPLDPVVAIELLDEAGSDVTGGSRDRDGQRSVRLSPGGHVGRVLRDDSRVDPMPFGDIPLFRELQKLLSAGGGPVNLEIARQIAEFAYRRKGPPFSAAPDDPRFLADAVRRPRCSSPGFTRLAFDEPIRRRRTRAPNGR